MMKGVRRREQGVGKSKAEEEAEGKRAMEKGVSEGASNCAK